MSCIAIDRRGGKCRLTQKQKSSWCKSHTRQQAALLKNYKHHTKKFETFDDTTICIDTQKIDECKSKETLREWAINIRKKRTLASRAIDSRTYHHAHFFDGGDFAHAGFIAFLRQARDLLDVALHSIENCHQLLLLQDSPSPFTHAAQFEETMPDHHDHALESRKKALLAESLKQDKVISAEDECDPFKAVEQWTREFWIGQILLFRKTIDHIKDESIRNQISDYMERLLIFSILKRPSLVAILEPDTPDIVTFLNSDSVSTADLESLAITFMSMPPKLILNAIIDTFRPSSDSNFHVILGRKVYTYPSAEPVPYIAWDRFAELTACPSCVARACPSLHDWNNVQRVSAVLPRYEGWRWRPGGEDFKQHNIAFGLLGVFITEQWPTSSYKTTFLSEHSVWRESEMPAGLRLKCEVNDASKRFLSILRSMPEIFSVIAWITADDSTIIPLPLHLTTLDRLWTLRIRVASSKEGLRFAPWLHDLYVGPPSEETATDPWKFSRNSALHVVIFDKMRHDFSGFQDLVVTKLVRAHGFEAKSNVQKQIAQKEYAAGNLPPYLGANDGFASIACGVIQADGPLFKLFMDGCLGVTSLLLDKPMIERWEAKSHFQRVMESMDCWVKYAERCDAWALLGDFFSLGGGTQTIEAPEETEATSAEDKKDSLIDASKKRSSDANMSTPQRLRQYFQTSPVVSIQSEYFTLAHLAEFVEE